jgi:hypothetical protein
MDVVMNSFSSMHNDIEEVVRGPIWIMPGVNDVRGLGPSRETEFELMGGMLSVYPNKSNIISNLSYIEMPPSNITYAQGYERVVFENGALIRKYEDGVSIMESDPLINIYNTGDGNTGNITLSIHAITLNGTLSSTSGEGKTWVETRYNNYNQIINSSQNPNAKSVWIFIPTNYPEAWAEFFEKKLKGAGLQPNNGYSIGIDPGNANQINIQINGTLNDTQGPDIFLSLYESKLDVKIR